MEIANTVLILVGAMIMVGNISGYMLFMEKMQDVVSSGNKKDSIWLRIGLVLLLFFFFGYLVVCLAFQSSLLTSLILFFGSIFVSVTLGLMSRLLDTAKERSVDIAEVLVGIIDARDPNLNGHSRYVKDLTVLFYQRLPRRIRFKINPISLEYAALMHDIGKLGVPESILNKPGKLNEEEWETMRQHPKIGVKLLQPLQPFDSISNWILYHHERMDGEGYYKLQGKQIPLAARLLSITDTYATITMRRAYKPPLSYEQAVEIIRSAAGKQLDQELVDIFLTIPKEELEKCIPEQIKY